MGTVTTRRVARGLLALALAGALGCGGDDASPEEPELAWLQVQRHCLESLAVSLSGRDPARAKALAVQAMEAAGEADALRGAASLAAALAERRREDLEAFGRHVEAAASALTPAPGLTRAVLVVAGRRRDAGEVDAARATLIAYKARINAAGLDRSDMARDVLRALRDLDRPRLVQVAIAPPAEAEEPAAAPVTILPPLSDATEIDFYPVD